MNLCILFHDRFVLILGMNLWDDLARSTRAQYTLRFKGRRLSEENFSKESERHEKLDDGVKESKK